MPRPDEIARFLTGNKQTRAPLAGRVEEIRPGKVITMRDGKKYIVDEHGALHLLAKQEG